jgi:hypothetical protein
MLSGRFGDATKGAVPGTITQRLSFVAGPRSITGATVEGCVPGSDTHHWVHASGCAGMISLTIVTAQM